MCRQGWAGDRSYYTRTGREFWYMTGNSSFLVLALTPDEHFKKIVLTRDDHDVWAQAIAERQAALAFDTGLG